MLTKDTKLRFWCQKVLPLVYDDSLSYYELLNKVVLHLNQNTENINQLIDFYNTFAEDVEDIIRQMMEDGDFNEIVADTLGSIIAEEYDPTKSYIIFDYCIFEGKLYRANGSTTGVFDPEKWVEKTVGYDLTTIQNYIYSLNAGNVSYDSTETYDDNTVGKELGKLNSAINDIVIVGNNTPFTNANIQGNAILKGTFVLDSLYEMSANQVLRGAGCVVTVSGNNAQIKLNNNTIIDGINFKGSWNPTRTTSGAHLVPILTETALTNHANTVYAENTDIHHSLLYTDTSIAERIKIVNCNFENINKCCIWINGGDHSTLKRTIIANNHFQTVWCGAAIFSEFCSLSANIYDRCITGNSISSGNAAVTGQIFKQCDCAIYYGADGGNSAHNEVSGCELAHSNLYGVYIKNITNATGNIFSGTQIVDSPIKAEIANDLSFVGCRLDTYINIASGAGNLITNCIIGNAYLNGNSLFTVPNDTLIYGNVPLRNINHSTINPSRNFIVNLDPDSSLSTGSAKLTVDKVNRTCRLYIMGTKTEGTIPAGLAVFTIPDEYAPSSSYPIPLILTVNNEPIIVYGLISQSTHGVYINARSDSNGFYGSCEYTY